MYCVSGGLQGIVIESLPLCKMPFQAIEAAFYVSVILTVSFLEMNPGPGINNYILPKFYTCKGNLKARWYIEFSATNISTGKLEKKRIVCPAKFETKKQREIWGKEFCKKITTRLESGQVFGIVPVPDEPTIEKGIVAELSGILETIKESIRAKSYITYNSAINKFKPFVDKIKPDLLISEFDNKQTINFRDHLKNDLKNSSRTANNTVEHLNTLYSHLAERKVLPPTPFKIKKLKEEVTSKNIAFTDKDRECVEKHLMQHEPELYLFTRFIYYAFIRPGELHQITLADVRLFERYIIIRGTISKNGKTETVQIIPPLFSELLKISINDEKQFYYLFGKGLVPSRYVSAKEVAFRRHQKVLKTLGLLESGYTLYSWKHTGAVNAYRAGVGVKELQKLLRHSSVSITDIYLKSLGLRTDPNIQNYSW